MSHQTLQLTLLSEIGERSTNDSELKIAICWFSVAPPPLAVPRPASLHVYLLNASPNGARRACSKFGCEPRLRRRRSGGRGRGDEASRHERPGRRGDARAEIVRHLYHGHPVDVCVRIDPFDEAFLVLIEAVKRSVSDADDEDRDAHREVAPG